MSRCPAGHESGADDYCDVCGLPIETPAAPAGGGDAATPSGAPAPPDAPPAEPAVPAGPEETACPNCGGASPANALFCEACGYDFTTGAAPRATSSMLDLDTPPVERTAEKLTSVPSAPDGSPPPPVAPPLAEAWVAEVWIDPDWYVAQDSSDALPSAGVPTVLPLTARSALVGRTSRSRSIHPDIDLSSDNGISRRHCQFTTDGTRWWVEDLGSSNGTYVGSAAGTLPRVPVPPGEKREIRPDEQIYLGAWTRIVIRRAMPGEV